jgi:uncharacterized protein with HEPN domain
VLGYDGSLAQAWCAVEPYNGRSLRDIWDEVRSGTSDIATKILLRGRSIVKVNLNPDAEEFSGVVLVDLWCNYGLGDSNEDEMLRGLDPLSIFSRTDSVANICLHLAKCLEDTGVAVSAFKVDLNKAISEALESTFEEVELEVKGFIQNLEVVGAANKAIQEIFQRETLEAHSSIPETFWNQTAKTLENCRKAVEDLEILLEDICSKTPRSLRSIKRLHKSLNLDDMGFDNKKLKQSLNNVLTYQRVFHILLLTASL